MNGDKEVSTDVKDVADLEAYRMAVKQPRHARVNFVYQTLPDDEDNR